MKKITPLILTTLFLFSACSPQTDLEQDLTIAGRATVAPDPVTTAELTDEEVIEKMPEIVFVMSHHYEGRNIVGFYITKHGEYKLFDFRNETNDETYDIMKVYDRLEEVTCLEKPSDFTNWSRSSSDIMNVPLISQNELVDLYRVLLSVDKNKELEPPPLEYFDDVLDINDQAPQGQHQLYGIIANEMEGVSDEVIFLLTFGDGGILRKGDVNVRLDNLYKSVTRYYWFLNYWY